MMDFGPEQEHIGRQWAEIAATGGLDDLEDPRALIASGVDPEDARAMTGSDVGWYSVAGVEAGDAVAPGVRVPELDLNVSPDIAQELGDLPGDTLQQDGQQ